MVRVLIVDDEEPARRRLARLLRDLNDVLVVGEARNGEEAIERTADRQPDVVLLDIQMPVLNGLEAAVRIPPPRPQIVFCTAFDQYAIQAFELNAVDYLLKPVNRQRLARAIGRARERLSGRGRLQQDLKAAGSVQKRLFPTLLPVLEHLDYSGACIPAGEIGGDYYDFLQLSEGKLGIALGDVSGKGVYAGLLMAGLQGRLQSQAYDQTELPVLFERVNQGMWEATDPNKYATLVYAVFDNASCSLSYVNAGHLPPLLARPNGVSGSFEFQRMTAGGPPVGMFPGTRYEQGNLCLGRGDVVVLFTDGVTEAMGPDGEEFGYCRLESLIEEAGVESAARIKDRILAEVEHFSGDSDQEDDVTVTVLKLR